MKAVNSIKSFLKKESPKPKIIVIYWPTACGKTSLSVKIAKFLDTEIISTDSRQIYRQMNIGTGKITHNEMQWVHHHMIDIIEPNLPFSVWKFQKQTIIEIEKLIKQWKIPILCWGTGLYIDSLIYDFSLPKTPNSNILRKELEQEFQQFWAEHMYKKLEFLDPLYAREIHPHNTKYVLRAIEIKLLTGKSKSEFREEKVLKYDTLFLTPYDWEREILYRKINKRVETIFESGLVEEVKKLLMIPWWRWSLASEGIWYTEVIDFLDKKISLEEALLLVQQHSRNYAKRQLTWFRRYENWEKNFFQWGNL